MSERATNYGFGRFEPTPVAPLPSRENISPAMLAAGRAAFLKERDKLDDLHDYFLNDLDDFLREVYRKMAGAA